VAGTVSGNLEMIDVDCGGEAFEAWCNRIRSADPALLDRVVIEATPSGGRHVIYRCRTEVCGNMKLAQRKVMFSSNEPAIMYGKTFIPRKDRNGSWCVLLTLIETRGEGGMFLCAPSVGYTVQQGQITNIPIISENERDLLLDAAWSLNEYVPDVVDVPAVDGSPAGGSKSSSPSGGRPGDDFNARGDVHELLVQHGWTLAKAGENEYWRRPGKTSGWSATLKDRVFYVFSSNANPFEPNKAYSPFAAYAWLEHNGDFAAAATRLRELGYGTDLPPVVDGVDLSAFIPASEELDDQAPKIEDPGPLQEEMLRIPGLISEVMDYALQTAPYPNQVLAFCGALALQAFLAGRKVCDPGDNRTNIYLLGLAHSAAGKEWPRRTNTQIIHRIGLAECLGDRFASGEGIQDALFLNPSMLFQTDEIDGVLQAINKATDARHESIVTTLLTMYSSANSVFPMRRKAGKEPLGVIDQPSLVLFGTAIPNHYYEALSERMLTNGLFARMIIMEAGKRSAGQEPCIRDLPPRVLATAKWWADYRSGSGNLQHWHPAPTIIAHTEDARRILAEARSQADAEYAKAEEGNDAVGTTVWGRVSEQVRKLAVLYAVSQDHLSPSIGGDAVAWAVQFVMHQTRRMLFMASQFVADNPFHAACLKVMQKLRETPGHQLSHSVLLKRMKIDAKSFRDLIDTLSQRGDVAVKSVTTPGRTGVMYELLRE
jgi:hypothetical protein